MAEIPNKILIHTPSRLHFTLIDLNGKLGRIDGGIGVALAKPNWSLEISQALEWSAPEFLNDLLKILRNRLHLSKRYNFEFKSELPAHVGLGSQTQLSIAVAHGLSILEGQKHSIIELASIVGRGGTSGIGIAAYTHGGFILDGGHTFRDKPEFLPSHFSNAKPAILVHRQKVPEDWYFVVAIPEVGKGKFGSEEVKIFKKYCPIPNKEVEKLSRFILIQMLPAIAEDDLESFGEGLNCIQEVGFKRIENQLQHKFIKELQDYLNNGAGGAGLSSFGPATFCVVRTKRVAHKLANETEKFLTENNQKGKVFFTNANNIGAEINISEKQ
jgi:beta-ribofuranosylaminobenzene 5'-phosphate synthase